MQDTIKEFLVSLGFKVDDSSLNAAKRAMGIAEASVTSFANSSLKNFAKAGAGVTAFIVAANVGLAKYINGLAQSDLQTQMFARRMWLSVDAARAYQNAIGALGVNINDLYLSPELMTKYLELNNQSKAISVPTADYESSMQGVRDITFQFQRLKLEGTVALQWIGYYLTKYLAGPMGDVKGWLTKINDQIQQTMPEWTRRVAEVASWFVRLGKAAWDIRDAIGAVVGVITAFKLINLASSPIGMLILGMTALLLLVDDFTTFESGGESAFPKLWEWVDKFKKQISDSGYIKQFTNDIKMVVTWVKELGAWFETIGRSKTFLALISDVKSILSNLVLIIQGTAGWFDELGKKLKDNGDLSKFTTDIGKLALSILDVDNAIAALMLKFGKGGLGDSIQHNLINMLEIVDGLVRSISGGLEIITGILSGDSNKVNEGIGGVVKGADSALFGPNGDKVYKSQKSFGDNLAKNSLGDGFSNAVKNSQSGETPWSKFINGLGADIHGLLSKITGSGIAKTSFGGSSGLDGSILSGASGASYMSYLYPQTNNSHITQVTMSPTYNITGATNPSSVATTVNKTSNAMLTRWSQGVVR